MSDIVKIDKNASAITVIVKMLKWLSGQKIPQSILTQLFIDLIVRAIEELLRKDAPKSTDRKTINANYTSQIVRPKVLNPFLNAGEASPDSYSPATTGSDSHSTGIDDLGELKSLTVYITAVPIYFGRIFARNQQGDLVHKPDIFKFGYVSFFGSGYTETYQIDFENSYFVPPIGCYGAYVWLAENVQATAVLTYFAKEQ